MRKNGFTLVELMVVVAIIGVLAAVALPKFLNAGNKAKVTELPSAIITIHKAQLIHNGEFGNYASCPWADADNNNVNDNIVSELGLYMGGNYFHYTTDLVGQSFVVRAEVYKSIGGAKIGTRVSVDEDYGFAYDGDASAIAALKSYSSYLKD